MGLVSLQNIETNGVGIVIKYTNYWGWYYHQIYKLMGLVSPLDVQTNGVGITLKHTN